MITTLPFSSEVFFFIASILLLAGVLMLVNAASARRARKALSCLRVLRAGSGKASIAQPLAGDVLCVLVVLTVYSILLAVLDRWISSFLVGLGLILALWAGNRLKEAILDEPLVFSDVFLAGHALRYPRLYFGYAPLWFWPLLLALIAALGVGISREPEAGISWAPWAAWGSMAFDALLFLALFVAKGWSSWLTRAHPLAFSANEDAARYTPIGASFYYLLWHAKYRRKIQEFVRFDERVIPRSHRGSRTEGSASKQRHLLMVQAESFCCIHSLLERKSVIPNIERLIQEGRGGDLDLDWRGAYTMRSEFSVLTGRRMAAVETYGFDPYRLAAMEPMESLAWDLRSAGWKTIAWHPNDGRFFDRVQVLKNLGFEEFWDLDKLKEVYGERLEKHGRYASDEALLELAAEFLHAQKEQTFLFVITMENHGPWTAAMQGEGMNENESRRRGNAHELSEVNFYESHLRSLDAGIGRVMDAVVSGALRSSVILYGDHIPGLKALSIDKMMKRFGHDMRNTAWGYWHPGMTPLSQTRRPETLRRVILGELGIQPKRPEPKLPSH